jgi:hypothetical protein
MLQQACRAPLLLLLLSACATMDPSPGELEDPSPRFANLQRAAQYPWTDDGHCVVREASNEWPVLAERCYHALDHKRVKLRDVTGRCAVASTGAEVAAVGLCVFMAPEIVTGAVIVIGAVVVAAAIQEGIDAYQRNASRERAKPRTQTRPSSQQGPVTKRAPTPKGLGPDWVPPASADPTERSECEPVPVRHAGEDVPHNECADKFPPNRYPGMDVLVGGARFDALQVGVRVLWEIKTHQFDTYNAFIRDQEIEKELTQLRKERDAALACGYDFVVGVSTQAHKDALLNRDQTLDIVVTGCKR